MPLEVCETERAGNGFDGRPEHQTGIAAIVEDRLTPQRDVNMSEICSNLTMAPGEVDMFSNPQVIDLPTRESPTPELTIVSEEYFRDLINAPAANNFFTAN
jgi:hypothetical protein